MALCTKRVFSQLLKQTLCRGGNALRTGSCRRVTSFLYREAHVSSDLSLHVKPHVSEKHGAFCSKGRSVSSNSPYSTIESAFTKPQQHPSVDVFNIDVLVSLLRQENAVDICVIRVPKELKYAEYFVVVSGSSTRHLKAMAAYAIKVYKFMKREGDPNVLLEGKDTEDWMCIDFGGMVVHFLLPETRDVYELEKLWTLRSYDEQLSRIPEQILPSDFISDAETK